MKRRICILSAAVIVLAAVIIPVKPISREDAAFSGAVSSCTEMTERWYGDSDRVIEKALADEPYIDTLCGYFDERQTDFTDSGTVRSDAIAEMAEKADISLSAADTTVTLTDISEQGDTAVLTLYEWTFFEYDDLRDDIVTTDVSGFGTEHKVTVKHTDIGYEIISDIYDESGSTGISTAEETEDAEKTEETENDGAGEETDIADTAEETDSGVTEMTVTAPSYLAAPKYYSGYDVYAAVKYSDSYVYKKSIGTFEQKYYNSSYGNYGNLGGDCANFVSQCIHAGGMPFYRCSHAGKSGTYCTCGWYYYTGSNRTATWTGAPYLRNWMGANRGKIIDDIDADDVFVGSPVFQMKEGRTKWHHATICVGFNSAGTPVVNSHTADWYHAVWNYEGDTTRYSTVQLTSEQVYDAAICGTDMYSGAELDERAEAVEVSAWGYSTVGNSMTCKLYVDGKYLRDASTEEEKSDRRYYNVYERVDISSLSVGEHTVKLVYSTKTGSQAQCQVAFIKAAKASDPPLPDGGITLEAGFSYRLTAVGSTAQCVSSDSSVAAVSDGVITALSPGRTTVSCGDGSVVAVTVTEKSGVWTENMTENGSITEYRYAVSPKIVSRIPVFADGYTLQSEEKKYTEWSELKSTVGKIEAGSLLKIESTSVKSLPRYNTSTTKPTDIYSSPGSGTVIWHYCADHTEIVYEKKTVSGVSWGRTQHGWIKLSSCTKKDTVSVTTYNYRTRESYIEYTYTAQPYYTEWQISPLTDTETAIVERRTLYLADKGDINGDGDADILDLQRMEQLILNDSQAGSTADLDGNGKVDAADLAVLRLILLGY